MSKYPTLEDLKIDDIFTAQEQEELRQQRSLFNNSGEESKKLLTQKTNGAFLGVEMCHYLDENGAVVFSEPKSDAENNISLPECQDKNKVIALDQNSKHTTPRATTIPEISAYDEKYGVRKVIIKKDKKGKIGIQCRCINNGVFISFILADSPASKSDMKFGDQILEFNGSCTTGKTENQMAKLIKDAPSEGIVVILRERPYERIVTLLKDSQGKMGFSLKDGCITEVLKDSSASKNGVLTNQQIIEVNGMNIIGLEDKVVQRMIDAVPQKVVITTMPKALYTILIKKLGSSQLKREMDRSVPDL